MLSFQDDDIGDVYQDEENMAALLVHRDAKNGGLLVVSTLHIMFLKEKRFAFNSTWYIVSFALSQTDSQRVQMVT
jgi:hypothetical protein